MGKTRINTNLDFYHPICYLLSWARRTSACISIGQLGPSGRQILLIEIHLFFCLYLVNRSHTVSALRTYPKRNPVQQNNSQTTVHQLIARKSKKIMMINYRKVYLAQNFYEQPYKLQYFDKNQLSLISTMYSMNDNPQELRAKFATMGVLLLLDSPAQLQFGIDNISWKVGSQFKGIKLIPLGTHIITYSLKNQNYMFPVKKFLNFRFNKNNEAERIHVYRWSVEEDRFLILKGEQAEGYREGVKKYHFDSFLGPYPLENVQFWSQNTSYITKEVLGKLDPIQSFENFREEYGKKKKQEKVQKLNIDSDQEQPNFQDIEAEMNQQSHEKEDKGKNKRKDTQQFKDFGGNIYYSQIPRRLNAFPSEISMANIDRTPILDAVLKKQWPQNHIHILGELQYSYISFLIGQCVESYNQWKHLILLISQSQTAFHTHRQLMLEFIPVLYEQIKQFPQDFFHDEISKGNFLSRCLKRLKTYIGEDGISKKVGSRIKKLLQMVQKKFNFYASDQQQDDAPVIVEEGQKYF